MKKIIRDYPTESNETKKNIPNLAVISKNLQKTWETYSQEQKNEFKSKLMSDAKTIQGIQEFDDIFRQTQAI